MNTKNSNTTGLRTLDRLGADPRVSNIYRDSDGIWCELADGFENGYDPGTHQIHEDTARRVLDMVSLIRPCDCAECSQRLARDPAAVQLGRKGGLVKSAAKAEAARVNGAKGGRKPKPTE